MTNPPVRIVELICTENATRGKGTDEDPHRTLTQYWTKAGALVFEIDPYVIPLAKFQWKEDFATTALGQARGIFAAETKQTRRGRFHPWPMADSGDSNARKDFVEFLKSCSGVVFKCEDDAMWITADHPLFEPIEDRMNVPTYDLHYKARDGTVGSALLREHCFYFIRRKPPTP